MTRLNGGPWSRYVAIGDSFTEGMSDPDPTRPDRFIGWADRLAAHLQARATGAGLPFGYANLAVRGRLLADVVGPQLDAALALGPDLVSIVGGGNDILRPRADIEALAGRLEAAVVTIRATGADVLMATPVDPSDAPLVKATRGRAGAYSAYIFGIAQRHGCAVIDQWSLPSLRDWRMWAEDRIHMTTDGHRRVALEAVWALGAPRPGAAGDEHDPDGSLTDWRMPLPPQDPKAFREAASANAKWAKEYVAPWVERRIRGTSSGDNLGAKRPTLEPIDLPADA